jgi:hypothetical protein
MLQLVWWPWSELNVTQKQITRGRPTNFQLCVEKWEEIA